MDCSSLQQILYLFVNRLFGPVFLLTLLANSPEGLKIYITCSDMMETLDSS